MEHKKKEKKTTTYDVGHPCPSLGQAQQYEGVKYLLDVYSTPYIFPELFFGTFKHSITMSPFSYTWLIFGMAL